MYKFSNRLYTLFHNRLFIKRPFFNGFYNNANQTKKYAWTKAFSPIIIGLGTTVGIFFTSWHLYSTSISSYKTPKIYKDYDEEQNPLEEAIKKSRSLLRRVKDEYGIPGVVVGVSINGHSVWEEGIGFSSLENQVPCTDLTVMRIASISKSITMALVGRLLEEKKLNLDAPIQDYVPQFPEKTFNEEKVSITTRHLVSHVSGIRHYDKTLPSEKKEEKEKRDVDNEEFYSKKNFKTVVDALSLFKDDPLHYKPGMKYLYTTHGFTLLSAVLEAAAKKPITTQFTKLFQDLAMNRTHLDVTEKLIYDRSSYYSRNAEGIITNCPYVDNSSKWAGGGLLSTVGDLLKFGNAMLYSYQNKNGQVPGYIKSSTMELIWKPAKLVNQEKSIHYGMGWMVQPKEEKCGGVEKKDLFIFHTGGALGASSILLIAPSEDEHTLPHGIVVSILANLSSVSLRQVAFDIAKLFKKPMSQTI